MRRLWSSIARLQRTRKLETQQASGPQDACHALCDNARCDVGRLLAQARIQGSGGACPPPISPSSCQYVQPDFSFWIWNGYVDVPMYAPPSTKYWIRACCGPLAGSVAGVFSRPSACLSMSRAISETLAGIVGSDKFVLREPSAEAQMPDPTQSCESEISKQPNFGPFLSPKQNRARVTETGKKSKITRIYQFSNSPHGYGYSHAIRDHTVLPATRQR